MCLAQHGETVATPGSFNTEVGLPLTVLRAGASTRYLVLEMGARHRGDISYLATLTPPTVGVVLNVGTATLVNSAAAQPSPRPKANSCKPSHPRITAGWRS